MKTARTRLGEGKSDFERRLLRAYQHEGPSDEARGKVLAIVGVGSALGASAAASTASATPKIVSAFAASLGKWISAGALVVAATGLAAGGYVLVNPPPEGATNTAPAAASASAVVSPPPRARAPVSTATSIPTIAPVEAVPTSDAPVARSLVAPPRAEAASVARPAAPADPLLLGDQVAAIDRAREALSSGDATRALAALEAYEKSFPNGTLNQEATALRIEALLKMGNRAAAAALADSFLAAHPTSPYASRIRSLLGQNP
jgi:outer membrane lipoprotein YfiO